MPAVSAATVAGVDCDSTAATYNSRSLAIRVLRNPDAYVPGSTWLTNLSSLAPLRPLDALSTSSTVVMSSPTVAQNATASLVAASAVADRKLFASFSACAIPGSSPTWKRRSLSPSSTGCTASHAAGAPAYMTASVRAFAPATPPDTGAST